MALIRAFLGAASDPSAGGGSSSGITPNQALGAQPAWFIDPINGNNSNDGTTLATAIQTRAEFYRRMIEVTLTVSPTVTITSSLLAGDVFYSTIEIPFPLILNFVGIPTPLIVPTAISGYVPSNGATNTFSQLTLAGINFGPLINKVIEFNDGAGTVVSAIILADLGANTAHISPQINLNTTAPANFANGQVVNVWDMPSLGASVNLNNGAFAHKYFRATTFVNKGGRCDLYNCLGNFANFGTTGTLINCFSNSVLAIAGITDFRGGFCRTSASGGTVRIPNDCTTPGITSGQIGVTTTEVGSFPGFIPSIELFVSALDNFALRILEGGRILIQGNIYGNNLSPLAMSVEGSNTVTEFEKGTNFTGSQTVSFVDKLLTASLTSLTTINELVDPVNNRVIGSLGPYQSRLDAQKNLQGPIAETLPRVAMSSRQAVVSGTLYFMQIYLEAGDLVSNSHIVVGLAGVAETFGRVGLWNVTTGALLASSADQVGAWATIGIHSQAFTVPFLVPIAGFYFIGFLVLAATGPGIGIVMAISANSVGHTVPIGGGTLIFGSQVGLVDLPNPLTIAAGTAPGFFWMAVS